MVQGIERLLRGDIGMSWRERYDNENTRARGSRTS
jgi:hypothetical protein